MYHKYLGSCYLKGDFTWALLLNENNSSGICRFLPDQVEPDTVEELIKRGEVGRYNSSLGYFQNVLNFGLGRGIRLRRNRLAALKADTADTPGQLQ